MWVLTDFQIARPLWESSQKDSLAWLSRAYVTAKGQRFGASQSDEAHERMDKLVSRYGCKSPQIETRGHEIRDFCHGDWAQMEVYRLHENPHGVALDRRMEIFARGALRAFRELYQDPNHTPPNEVIHVTCTGYASPSPVQVFCESRGWGRNTRIAQLYHSGCYASVPAVRQAMGSAIWMKNAGTVKSSIDIAHTEMCSLHLDPLNPHPEQFVIHSLFADGNVRYSVKAWDGEAPGLAVRALHEEILPNTTHEMQWLLQPYAFRMALSRSVPELLANVVEEFVEKLFHRAGLKPSRECVWALHPGGPRILEILQDKLRIRDEQMVQSRQVLAQYGNMSSATLPYIWDAILSDLSVPKGTRIPSLAFGPGLTLAGALLEKV